MPFVVTGGAQCMCSFGNPVVLNVLPKMQAQVSLPMAAQLDGAPVMNVGQAVVCKSPPLMAAALGVPPPCAPASVAWLPGQPNVLVKGVPVVTNSCQLACLVGGGVITVIM